MLARLTFLLVALPALALAADGGESRGRLHYSQPAPPPQATVQAAATAPVIAPPPALKSPSVDPSDCRMSCAQTYYMCRAGDHADDCAGPWGQCVASCNAPNLSPSFSTAP